MGLGNRHPRQFLNAKNLLPVWEEVFCFLRYGNNLSLKVTVTESDLEFANIGKDRQFVIGGSGKS